MSHPTQMNAVTIDRFGGPEVLDFSQQPLPQPGNGQVLVKIAYAGVGTWDPLMREGVFAEITGETPVFPMILGTDGSGTIAALGPDVDGLAEGDEVYFTGAALYAEYAVLDANAVSKVPRGLPLEQAGALPIGALTSLHGLLDELHLQPGQSVLINGASGDVGHLAVQLAKLLGARVLAVASGDDGVSMVRQLGADAAIDGRTADIAASIRDFAPEGLDAILTFITGPGLDAAMPEVRDGGRVAFPLGVEPEPRPRDGVTAHHFDLTLDTPEVIKGKMARLNDLIASGSFEVRIAQVFPLSEAARAHEALSRHRLGKILLSAAP
jgi:NADPH:quinone reductase-like Zn-dependent oxidoreductase